MREPMTPVTAEDLARAVIRMPPSLHDVCTMERALQDLGCADPSKPVVVVRKDDWEWMQRVLMLARAAARDPEGPAFNKGGKGCTHLDALSEEIL